MIPSDHGRNKPLRRLSFRDRSDLNTLVTSTWTGRSDMSCAHVCSECSLAIGSTQRGKHKFRSSCNAADAVASVGLMCSAIDALSKWMASNRLLLNPSKTQFIWLGGRRQLAKVDLPMLADTFPHVVFSTTVRDLGLTLETRNSIFLSMSI